MAPKWEVLAKKYGTKINIAEVDTQVNSELVERFEIKGLPTLILFKSDCKEDTCGIVYTGVK